MTKLKLSYDSQTDIPSGFAALYTEKEGVFTLTGVEGLQTQENVSRLEAALVKERKDHKSTKDALKKFGERTPEQIQAQADELEDLRLKVGDHSDKKVEEVIEQRVKVRLAPLERELVKAKSDLETVSKERETLSTTLTRGKIESHLRKSAETAKVIGTAIDDVVAIGSNLFEVTDDGAVIAREGAGIQAGLTPDIWITDQQKARPHWWPVSAGGGAKGGAGGGGGAANPWSKEGWNMTQQGIVVKQQGIEKANAMAAAAGTKVGATAPIVAKK